MSHQIFVFQNDLDVCAGLNRKPGDVVSHFFPDGVDQYYAHRDVTQSFSITIAHFRGNQTECLVSELHCFDKCVGCSVCGWRIFGKLNQKGSELFGGREISILAGDFK